MLTDQQLDEIHKALQMNGLTGDVANFLLALLTRIEALEDCALEDCDGE